MGIRDRIRRAGGTIDLVETDQHTFNEIVARDDTIGLLEERIAELEFALEDTGWVQMVTEGQAEFSRSGLSRIIAISRLMFIKNPLIQRAVNVKGYYVWGQGVEIEGRDDTVDELVQAWIDDEAHQDELFGQQARLLKEQTLETTGNLFFVLFPNTLTGDVKVRSIDVDEITDIVTNPEDRREVWFYRRTWSEASFDPESGVEVNAAKEAWYPDWRYQPAFCRPRVGNLPVRWDAPLYHVKVGGLERMRFGLPETYAANDWARAYKSFLEDWSTIVRSLSRFAWDVTSKKGKASATAARMGTKLAPTGTDAGIDRNPSPVAGAAFVHGDGDAIKAIPKTDAVIDADDAKALRLMVAAAMDLPDTILSGDPDQGNLATAKTLDRPTELAMLTRQQLWADIYRRLINYQIDWWVRAPRGPLQGEVTRQPGTGRVKVVLPDETDRTVDVTFPPILEQDVKPLMEAITLAHDTGLVDDETILRLMLQALGVEDIDELVDLLQQTKLEKENGGTLGNLVADAFRKGQDPAALLRGGATPPVPPGPTPPAPVPAA